MTRPAAADDKNREEDRQNVPQSVTLPRPGHNSDNSSVDGKKWASLSRISSEIDRPELITHRNSLGELADFEDFPSKGNLAFLKKNTMMDNSSRS
jgi:hypothetical protein